MMLYNLPLDILLEQTLPCLDVSNLATLSSTCRLFYTLCNDNRVWKGRVVSDFGLLLPLNTRQYTWKQLYIELDQGQRIYTWGENSDKRLGFGDQDNAGRDAFMRQIAIPRELRGLRSKGIVDIVAGGWSFHALDRRGQVWMWGWMQPRHPFRTIPPQQDLVRQPMCVRFPTQVRIKVIASGKLHAVALDDQGRLWHWANSWEPQQVHIIKATGPITHITAHWNYSTALTITGQVFLIPFPISPKCMIVSSEPIHKNDQFIKIAGLDDASIALTRSGQVFKLHFASNSQNNDPVHCAITELKRFSHFLQYSGCGTLFDYRRTILSAQAQQFAICSQGKALLGHETSMTDDEPQVLDTAGHEIQKVTFGNFHYGALTTEGRLLTWGLYSSGALGRGYEDDEQNETAPEIVEKLQDMFVFAVGFGGSHSGCAAIPRHLLDP